MKRRSSSSWSSLSDADGIYTRTRSSTSSSKRRRSQYPIIDPNDLISNLPTDLLQVILSKLSTSEAARTSVLSSLWVDLWRRRSDLVLDMRSVFKTRLLQRERVSKSLTRSFTKVMKKHCGNLESCTIYHHSYVGLDDKLERWIKEATHVKNAKALTIENHVATLGPNNGYDVLFVDPKTFSNQSLTSLSLCRFILPSAHGFNTCSNLKTLKLVDIIVNVSNLNEVLASCSSLDVLLLQCIYLRSSDVLRIENNNLKYLQVTTHSSTDRIEVYALRLEVLDVRCVFCEKDNFILVAPNLKFNRNYTASGIFPHISCNISYLTQEKKNIELMMSGLLKRCGSLSVHIDVTIQNEVNILKELLLLWSVKMNELEIVFKNNLKEGECSTNGRERGNLWGIINLFEDVNFRVGTVWMYNFSGSNNIEFELVSQFVNFWRKKMIGKLMIDMSSFPIPKRLKIEEAMTKLVELYEGNDEEFNIHFF